MLVSCKAISIQRSINAALIVTITIIHYAVFYRFQGCPVSLRFSLSLFHTNSALGLSLNTTCMDNVVTLLHPFLHMVSLTFSCQWQRNGWELTAGRGLAANYKEACLAQLMALVHWFRRTGARWKTLLRLVFFLCGLTWWLHPAPISPSLEATVRSVLHACLSDIIILCSA